MGGVLRQFSSKESFPTPNPGIESRASLLDGVEGKAVRCCLSPSQVEFLLPLSCFPSNLMSQVSWGQLKL